MIILPEQNAVFVGIPRTGSKAMSLWLEAAFRAEGGAGATRYPVESLHDWHATLSEALEASGYPLFRMWSFAVVRNPFDRLVSWAAMSDPNFESNGQYAVRRVLLEDNSRWMLPQTYFTDGVKQIYRFEKLDQAIIELRERLGISEDIEFPHEHETNHDHYRAYFDDELRQLVFEKYAEDFKAFDYGF